MGCCQKNPLEMIWCPFHVTRWRVVQDEAAMTCIYLWTEVMRQFCNVVINILKDSEILNSDLESVSEAVLSVGYDDLTLVENIFAF